MTDSTTDKQTTTTASAQPENVTQNKTYWRNYKGAVIREGNHFESDTGAMLYWHSYEATEAQSFLSGAADEAERAAQG